MSDEDCWLELKIFKVKVISDRPVLMVEETEYQEETIYPQLVTDYFAICAMFRWDLNPGNG